MSNCVEPYKLLLPAEWSAYDSYGRSALRHFVSELHDDRGRIIDIEQEEAEQEMRDRRSRGSRKANEELGRVLRSIEMEKEAAEQRRQMTSAYEFHKDQQQKARKARIDLLSQRAKGILNALKPRERSWNPNAFQDAVSLVCAGNDIHSSEVQSKRLEDEQRRERALEKKSQDEATKMKERLDRRVKEQRAAVRNKHDDTVTHTQDVFVRKHEGDTDARHRRTMKYIEALDRRARAKDTRHHREEVFVTNHAERSEQLEQRCLTARELGDSVREKAKSVRLNRWYERVKALSPKPPTQASGGALTARATVPRRSVSPTDQERAQLRDRRAVLGQKADAARQHHLHDKRMTMKSELERCSQRQSENLRNVEFDREGTNRMNMLEMSNALANAQSQRQEVLDRKVDDARHASIERVRRIAENQRRLAEEQHRAEDRLRTKDSSVDDARGRRLMALVGDTAFHKSHHATTIRVQQLDLTVDDDAKRSMSPNATLKRQQQTATPTGTTSKPASPVTGSPRYGSPHHAHHAHHPAPPTTSPNANAGQCLSRAAADGDNDAMSHINSLSDTKQSAISTKLQDATMRRVQSLAQSTRVRRDKSALRHDAQYTKLSLEDRERRFRAEEMKEKLRLRDTDAHERQDKYLTGIVERRRQHDARVDVVHTRRVELEDLEDSAKRSRFREREEHRMNVKRTASPPTSMNPT
eukprot:PhM_4_TR17313/c0_g1_i1/m.2036